jgi:hypothetical protein
MQLCEFYKMLHVCGLLHLVHDPAVAGVPCAARLLSISALCLTRMPPLSAGTGFAGQC